MLHLENTLMNVDLVLMRILKPGLRVEGLSTRNKDLHSGLPEGKSTHMVLLACFICQ